MKFRQQYWLQLTFAATIVTLLAVYPLVHMSVVRGREWQGSFAYLQGDEVEYAAYVNSLIQGRTRRNDPYTGRQDPAGVDGESFLSIQFVPPYTLAFFARVFGLSTSTAFALLMAIVPLAASAILFQLIYSATGKLRYATAGVLVVLCLGSVPTLWGLLQYLRGLPADFTHLRFLRRYVPGFPFPFLLGFFALTWNILSNSNRKRPYLQIAGASLAFAVLVFSYFFHWTAALAWLVCVAVIWLLLRPNNWTRDLKNLGILTGICLLVLIPYAGLVLNRSPHQAAATILVPTRQLDLVRVPELVGALLLLLLAVAVRFQLVHLRDRLVLFSLTFLLLPFAVFNQQLITGYSLQPAHYEVFVTNYALLLAVILLAWKLFAGLQTSETVQNSVLLVVSFLAVAWAGLEVAQSTRKFIPAFQTRDDAVPVAKRMLELSVKEPATADDLVFATDEVVADFLPTIAPQPVLWAPHMYAFADVSVEEDRRRLLQQLYYNGTRIEGVIDESSFTKLDPHRKNYFSALLGRGRLAQSGNSYWQPVSREEYSHAQKTFDTFMNSFDHETSLNPLISFVITARGGRFELSNLDRWYERDEGEAVGKYVIYRVRPRN